MPNAQNPNTSGQSVRAANRLIAATVAYRQALTALDASTSDNVGQAHTRMVVAADEYLTARTPVDAARDRVLTDNPNITTEDVGRKVVDAVTDVLGLFAATRGAPKAKPGADA